MANSVVCIFMQYTCRYKLKCLEFRYYEQYVIFAVADHKLKVTVLILKGAQSIHTRMSGTSIFVLKLFKLNTVLNTLYKCIHYIYMYVCVRIYILYIIIVIYRYI